MNSPILRFAKSSPAVELGFLLAGVSVCGIAIIQTAVILLAWLLSAL